MAGHVCDNCGSVVSESDQFCPECGSWIDPTSETVDDDGFEEFSLGEEPQPAPVGRPPLQVASQTLACPSCGAPNPDTNRHCEECGARLSQGSLPVAPRPAVQATAGVRAAMAISGLLFGVVVIAILFNLFAGDDETDPVASDSTSSTTTTTAPPPAELPVLSTSCSVQGLSGFECRNLLDETREYQINWEGLADDEVVTIDLIFPEAMLITGFIWDNLPADDDGFYQNYRARSITIESEGQLGVPDELADTPGSQQRPYVSARTNTLRITINTAYLPEERNGRVFTELAIQGITVIGRPAGDPTTTTSSTTTTTEG